jgi:cytochrome c556
MSVYDKLEQDEDYEAFRDGLKTLFAQIDDPKKLRATLQEQGYEEALEHVEMEQDEYEYKLNALQAIAKHIERRNPELLDELREDLETDPSDS